MARGIPRKALSPQCLPYFLIGAIWRIAMKTCTKCNKEKALTEFHKRKDGKYGVYAACKLCFSIKRKANYQKNKDKEQEKIKEYKSKNKEKINEYQKQYKEDNKETSRAYSKKYYLENKENSSKYAKANYQKNREKRIAQAQDWAKNNHSKRTSIFANYKATKLKATPAWFERKQIEKVYKEARKYGFHVDHIVPLQSKTVCGLHCWHNLQLLNASINCSKGNYHWPDM